MIKAVPSLKPKDLLNEITETSKELSVELVEMKSRNPTLISHAYLVSFKNDFKHNVVGIITYLSNFRNKWEHYSRKTKSHTMPRLATIWTRTTVL